MTTRKRTKRRWREELRFRRLVSYGSWLARRPELQGWAARVSACGSGVHEWFEVPGNVHSVYIVVSNDPTEGYLLRPQGFGWMLKVGPFVTSFLGSMDRWFSDIRKKHPRGPMYLSIELENTSYAEVPR